jgi:signal transduction histidine kinase
MTRGPAHPRLWLAYLGAGLAALVAYGLTSSLWIQACILLAGCSSALGAAVFAFVRNRPRYRGPWLLIFVGLIPYALGLTIWEVLTVKHGSAPFPSLADPFLLTFYPFLATSLVLLGSRLRFGGGALLDTGIIGLAFGVGAWVMLVEPYLAAELPGLQETTQIGFAAADLLVLAALVRLIASGGARGGSYALLAAGVASLLAADTAWNWLALRGNYSAGSYADLGLILAMLLLGAAFLHPSMQTLGAEEPSGGPGRLRLLLLAIAGLSAPGFLALDSSILDPVEVLLTTGPLFVLVLIRMGGAVSASARLQRELHEQNERLRQLDRLKDDFVASVSHELRTPLTSIRGYIELVLDGEAGEVTDDQRRFLAVVDRNSERLLHLVGDLLFVAQADRDELVLELDEVDLPMLATQSAEALRPRADQLELDLRLDVDPIPAVRGDSARLSQLIDNLVSNALKFTPAGGRVDLRVGQQNGRAVLEVADTGIGISDQDQARLFERFFRTSAAQERAIQGTGLGLAITRAIVVAHGGEIAVESAEGEGTTFRVELPLPHVLVEEGAPSSERLRVRS